MITQISTTPLYHHQPGLQLTTSTMPPPPSQQSNQQSTQSPANGPAPDGLPSPSDTADGAARGRRRTRDFSNGVVPGHGNGRDDSEGGDEGPEPVGSKRRRRSRKGMDKKHECPHEGCDKVYSRAEHLYRHQLNHNPKQIYHCDHPGCDRSFVRQDLCTRHKERHTAKGSHLGRRDQQQLLSSMQPPPNTADMGQGRRSTVPNNIPPAGLARSSTVDLGRVSNHSMTAMSPVHGPSGHPNDTSPPMHPVAQSPGAPPYTGSQTSPITNQLTRSRSDEFFHKGYEVNGQGPAHVPSQPMDQTGGAPHVGGYGAPYGGVSQPMMGGDAHQPYPHHDVSGTPNPNANRSWPAGHSQTPGPAATPPVTAQQSYGQFAGPNHSFPPPGAPHGQFPVPQQGAVAAQFVVPGQPAEGTMDQSTPSYHFPVMSDGYNRSPYNYPDDFTAWLLSDQALNANAFSIGAGPFSQNVGMSATAGLQAPFFSYDPLVAGQQTQPAPPQHPMTVNSIIDTSLPQSQLSEEKRQQIIDLIHMRFNEADEAPLKHQKEELMDGDMNKDDHVFSFTMMQTYIASYWVHFHPQLPILHRPTFIADTCPDLLLLAIMSLGASCLEKSHEEMVTTKSHDMANFLAWHLRWLLFQHRDFRPPAKLWVFQTLLLLEIYEKMYSTRPLHERAHIHHATTLTIMRRGSSLIGRNPIDSPPSVKSGHPGSDPASAWWNSWITNEATRRVAFAAFVMDSTHATMFGHSAVMVAHEIRLPLPCDESLWSATSGAEVGRQEASLQAHGIKPMTFLEGLKRTLHGQSVRTNPFGRTVLMAGLLSVSWHMNQRDLQLNSLGASQSLGGRDRWRASLTRAFDFWKKDYEDALRNMSEFNHHMGNGMSPGSALSRHPPFSFDDSNVSDSRVVYHHLAHMAMQVDIVDCQIFAGASRLLGRTISPKDYADTQRRMKENWAPTARARDATFYALRFLAAVLLPEGNSVGEKFNLSNELRRTSSNGHSPESMNSNGGAFYYNPREDFLLYRPWVLYFSALIVWAYGYALDGPIVQPQSAPKQISLTHGLRPAQPGQTAPMSQQHTPAPLHQPPAVPSTPQGDWQGNAPPGCPFPFPMSHSHRVADMRGFLQRVSSVKTSEELSHIPNRNGSVGLLLLLRDAFRTTRWELLHEASNLLSNCAELLIPGAGTVAAAPPA